MKSTFSLTQSVFFVGFMGAGKTSVARSVARTCSVAEIDMDHYLERRYEKKIADIFAESGEPYFRSLETKVLRDILAFDPHLVSCGGGVVMARENRELLKQACVVYLKVSLEETVRRISDPSSRPMLQDLEKAEKLNLERVILYEEVASITVDTLGKSVNEITREVKSELLKKGILCQQEK